MRGRRAGTAMVVVAAVIGGGLGLHRLGAAGKPSQVAPSPVAVAATATPPAMPAPPRRLPSASRLPRPIPRALPPLSTAGTADALVRAAQLAAAHHLRAGIAVLDTETGRYYGSGASMGQFATASVVKVMIAAYLLINQQMSGQTAELAYSMITRSDDDAANVLWGRAGGPSLEPWIAAHDGIENLGAPNGMQGVWGNTHVTARGLVRLYADLEADPAVWPWLGAAMHHAAHTADDGTDQFFGLFAAAPDAAIKQGWASGSADDSADAVINTTGFVDHDRYAVAILTEGIANNDTSDRLGFNPGQAAVVTTMARLVVASLS